MAYTPNVKTLRLRKHGGKRKATRWNGKNNWKIELKLAFEEPIKQGCVSKLGLEILVKRENPPTMNHLYTCFSFMWYYGWFASIVVGTFKFGTQVPNKYYIFQKFIFNNGNK
jgi:hypothetical protein